MKLLSFIVPCYNSAEYMEKCINSLIVAGEDAEVIIVNDGSTKDNTKDIAERYQNEYPNICKAINKENGGHGDAVNVGLKSASGRYFKVVDSDDWVDESALKKVIKTLKGFEEKGQFPEAVIVNYVYEHAKDNTQRVVNFRKKFPIEKAFSFEESKRFDVGQFIAMHNVIYLTDMLKTINLTLPKHTFYVDNIFVYTPLPFVKKFYYLDVDFYRYFVGREGQSVQEDIQMQRIDQHIKVTKMMIDKYDLSTIKETNKKLYNYMRDSLLIMVVITSIFLIKRGEKEDLEKKQELWEYFSKKQPKECKKGKKKFVGITASNNPFKRWLAKVVYVFAVKKFKLN